MSETKEGMKKALPLIMKLLASPKFIESISEEGYKIDWKNMERFIYDSTGWKPTEFIGDIMNEKKSLDDRMKDQYENRTRYYLPRRTYTIVRIDGRSFHTYCKNLTRPYDMRFVYAMNTAALYLCKDIQGCQFAYIQSDEISLLLTDFADIGTQAWFDGNLQKIASVSASIATAAFNRGASNQNLIPAATFDSRAFTIPDYVEVENYFISRQKDAIRNSVSTLAQTLFSPKALLGKDTETMKKMIAGKAGLIKIWEEEAPAFKFGRMARKTILNTFAIDPILPVFTRDRTLLRRLIPQVWSEDKKEN